MPYVLRSLMIFSVICFSLFICTLFANLTIEQLDISPNKRNIILVDAISSGKLLFVEEISKQYNFINVYSSKTEKHYLNHPNDNTKGILFKGKETIILLKKLNPEAILAASDFGMDTFHEILGYFPELPQNDPTLMSSRVNKFEMQKRVGDLGIETELISSWKEADSFLIKFFEQSPLRKVVIKPTQDGGSKNVLIYDINDYKNGSIETFIKEVLGTTGSYGRVNAEMIIQRFIRGPEVVVNSVTLNHKFNSNSGIKGSIHYTTDVYQYHKQQRAHTRGNLYHANISLYENDKRMEELLDFKDKVLNRLGYFIGASHLEAIYDLDDKKWRLVEVAERIAGHLDSVMGSIATGYGPAKASLDSFLNPKALIVQFPNGKYKLKTPTVLFSFIAEMPGKVDYKEVVALVKMLPSYKYHKIFGSEKFEPTTGLDNVPAAVILSHSNKKQIEADLNKLVKAENKWFGAPNSKIIPLCSNLLSDMDDMIHWQLFVP